MAKKEKKSIKYQLWDTAGQTKMVHITKQFLHGAMGIMICYAVNDLASFQQCEW